MAGGIDIELVGAARFAATTAQAGRELLTLDSGSAAAGRRVAERAAVRAPKRTGRLAASIRPVVTAPGFTVTTAPLSYANVQNYGWAAHNIEPTYYLTGVLPIAENEITDAYSKNIDQILNTVRGQ